MLHLYIYNQGNGWQVTIEELGRYFEQAATRPPLRPDDERQTPVQSADRESPPAEVVEAIGAYLTLAEVLGRRTGELHVELAEAAGDPAFTPEPVHRRRSRRRSGHDARER